MAGTVAASSPPVHPSAPASTTPMMQPENTNTPVHRNVYMMPVPQGNTSSRIIRPVPGVKCLSITLIVLTGILVTLGIVAIVLKAHMSYVGNPIWTGLLFLLTTGILGIFVHRRRNSLCVNIGFLVVTIISSIFTYQLMQFAWIVAAAESHWGDCYPGGGYYYYNCGPYWARVLVSVVVGFCALAAGILCVVSCSVTIYGTFNCCYDCCNCCRNPSQQPQTMVHYSNHTGVVLTPIAIGSGMQVLSATQIPTQMQPQSIPVMQHSQADGSKPMYIVATPPQAYLQSSPPAYASSPQVFIVADNHGNQQATAVAVSNSAPRVTAINQVSNPAVVVASNPTPQVNSPSGGQVANNPENWQKF